MNYPAPSYHVEPPTPKNNTMTICIIIIVCIVIFIIILAVVGIALGVGLGVGLAGNHNNGQYTDEGADTGNFPVLSAPIVNCIYGDSSTCGCSATKPSFLSPRIVNGYTAVPNSWPWMVALFINNGQAFCGGFLVTYQHVITAAHCVNDVAASTIKVYAGIHQLSDRDSGQSRAVSTINVHPNYESSHSDIAILTLESAFRQTTTVGKCCLTFNTSLPSMNEHAVITGWGLTSFDSVKKPNNLLQGVIQIQSSSSQSPSVVNDEFYASYAGTDACFGDSGGPLMTSVDNAWTCTGIVSGGLVIDGKSCGTTGVYTRVSAYQSFINGIING